jgi:DNA-binding NtrC family response regulator
MPIVALMVSEQDRELLTNVASRGQLELRLAYSCGDAWAILSESEAPVVFCDRDLPATEWRNLVQLFASAAHRPSVILASRVVDDYLWQEVIRNGGYDVLAKPLREDDVVRTIRLASSYWSMKTSPLPLKRHR